MSASARTTDRPCDALAFLAESVSSANTAAARADFAYDALAGLLPRSTGSYPWGEPGYALRATSDAIVVEYYDRAGEQDGDWSLTTEQAAAVVWATVRGENVEHALEYAAERPVPTHAEVIAAIASFIRGKEAA